MLSSPAAPELAEHSMVYPMATPWQIFWRRLRGRRLAMAAALLLALFYLFALVAGFLAPYHYERQDRERFHHPPIRPFFRGGALLIPRYREAGRGHYQVDRADAKPLRWWVRGDAYPFLGLRLNRHLFGTDDRDHPVYLLGTDQFGRDVFSRLWYGSQISLSIGVLGIALSFSIGLLLGGVAGYFGGWVDTTIMRLCELIMSIPGLYLIISLRSTFPPKLSSSQVYALIVVILSFIGWASMARVIRGMTLSLRERPFVLAARALGQSHSRIIFRHILPNTLSYVIVAATLSIPYYILGEVVLSFLGVGIQEPEASWGNMLNAAQNTEALRNYPWLLCPGAAIFVTVLAFNFLGDGLRDAVDSRTVSG